MYEAYLSFLEPLYIGALQDAAHALATPTTNFGLPCIYFALVLVGYGAMRFVDFHVVGAKCKAKKPLKDGAVEKKPSKCVIKKVVDGGKSFFTGDFAPTYMDFCNADTNRGAYSFDYSETAE